MANREAMGAKRDLTRRRDLVVVGASAGGVRALEVLLAALPDTLDATLLIVLHRLPVADSRLAASLGRAAALPVAEATHEQSLEPGAALVAPPDRHMLLAGDGRVRLVRGPRENRHRPAVDALFRSAAVHGTSRVVGVVLTGLLNDGTAGLIAVQRCGGVALVQDPADADFPDMPRSALRYPEADRMAPLAELPGLVEALAGTEAPPPPPVAPELRAEAEASLRAGAEYPADQGTDPGGGSLVALSCPECGGPLSQRQHEGFHSYRCRVGHAFTPEALMEEQDEAIERSLWVALRSLEERAGMLEGMAREQRRRGRTLTLSGLEDRAQEAREHADRIRAVLTGQGRGRVPA